MRARHFLAAALALIPAAATAGETITYGYDAKGRLIRSERTGSVNQNVITDYEFDAADNRTKVSVSGARSRVIVVPLGGLRLLPIS